MMNYKEMVARLEYENALIDTTDAQREVNTWRIKWLEALHRDKPAYEPTNSTDVILEVLKQPGFRFSPNFLLKED